MESYQDYPNLACHVESGVRVLVVKARQLLDDTAEPLRRDLDRAMREQGPSQVVLSLERVGVVSSAGISTLFTLLKRVKALDGRLVLCGLTPQVTMVLRLCQLIAQEDGAGPFVFAAEPDVPAAVGRLSGAP
jgi:anti-anti-sigma factor